MKVNSGFVKTLDGKWVLIAAIQVVDLIKAKKAKLKESSEYILTIQTSAGKWDVWKGEDENEGIGEQMTFMKKCAEVGK